MFGFDLVRGDFFFKRDLMSIYCSKGEGSHVNFFFEREKGSHINCLFEGEEDAISIFCSKGEGISR